MAIKNVWREFNRKAHAPLGSLSGLFANEVFAWDIFHKHENGSGFLAALGEVRKAMREYMLTAAILPQDAKGLVSSGSFNNEYRVHGPGRGRALHWGGVRRPRPCAQY